MATAKGEYGTITGLETLGLFGVVFTMPLVQAWSLIKKPFVPSDRVRSWRRVKADAGFGYAVSVMNARMIQFVDGSTQKVCEKWAPTVGAKVEVEKIDEGAQILWTTPKGRKRVLVYFHGGGYALPVPPFTMAFWHTVTGLLNEKDKDIGMATLEYTLVPKATFPTQLKQAIACIKHLVASGLKPEDIYLVGDSAGAALILQVLAHILRPIPGIPEFSLGNSKLGEVVFISPWVALECNSPSFTSNASTDIFPPAFYEHLASLVKQDVPESLWAYVSPSSAPKGWFDGVDKLVTRALITAGAAECLRDDIESFSKEFCAVHKQASLITIPGGTHNEPYGTFEAGESDYGEWPPRIASWLAEGMV